MKYYRDIQDFQRWLYRQNLSINSIKTYVGCIERFLEYSVPISKQGLLGYKDKLLDKYNPRTVNVNIIAINKYLDYCDLNEYALTQVKLQQKPSIDNVISRMEYKLFKKKLKEEGDLKAYFLIKFLGMTGARVSEVVQIRIEDLDRGYTQILGKGHKLRRLLFPESLRLETLHWARTLGKRKGFLFVNGNEEPLTTRGVAYIIKKFATKYEMDLKVIYPHSFRHRFAQNFIEKYPNIALLADILGHSSIETTRIYLRKSQQEQQYLINKLVTW